MNYELLKTLKEVGFPQKYTFHTLYDPEAGETESERMPYEPTTDELIEELGEGFCVIGRTETGFSATGYPGNEYEDGTGLVYVHGSTPKEALINLYIELNLHKYGKTN